MIDTLLQTGIVPAVILGLALWNADSALSKAGAQALYMGIRRTVDNPSESAVSRGIGEFLKEYFPGHLSPGKFFRNILLLSVSSVLVVLAIYTYKTPGMAQQLVTVGFLRQFIGNGLVVTFLVNCFTFAVYPYVLNAIADGSVAKNCGVIVIDILAKVALFVALTAVTYVGFTLLGLAFNGNIMQAFSAIPPTLLGAISFSNLTAVYLYSVLISSFPVFVVIFIQLMVKHPGMSKLMRKVLFWLPFDEKPIRAISVLFAVFFGMFSFALSLVLFPF